MMNGKGGTRFIVKKLLKLKIIAHGSTDNYSGPSFIKFFQILQKNRQMFVLVTEQRSMFREAKNNCSCPPPLMATFISSTAKK